VAATHIEHLDFAVEAVPRIEAEIVAVVEKSRLGNWRAAKRRYPVSRALTRVSAAAMQLDLLGR
jgi:hypothetical protein